jgi:uncharacterized damage-inducible protein DinB
MSLSDYLVEGFQFDKWANLVWLECLTRKQFEGPEIGILGHILSAQSTWLKRCQGISLSQLPVVVPSVKTIEELNREWLDVLGSRELDEVIEFTRTTGEAFTLSLRDVVLQVLNHGTYHRGELRGLCRARDDDDFPETDWMRFTRTKL